MRVLHFCAGLQGWNGMSNMARQLVAEELAAGHDSRLTNRLEEIAGKIDIVEIHGAWLPVVHKAAKQAKAIGAKLIICPAGSYDPVRRHFHGWKKLLMAPWEHAMIRRADVVQATCPEEVEWIVGYSPKCSVELTDLRRFFNLSNAPDLTACLKDLRALKRPIHLLYLGRRHPLKGVEYLVQAVRKINEGENRVSLHEVSNKFAEDLEKEWDWADALVLPTLSENFGLVVAEALERGKPVITTDGAPAWKGQKGIVYLMGYRNADARTRVSLLKHAILEFLPPDQP